MGKSTKVHVYAKYILAFLSRESVFSPNPMWYRPIWSCDFRCNFHALQSSGIGHTGDRVTLVRILYIYQLAIRQSHSRPRLDSCSMGLAILSALVRDVV